MQRPAGGQRSADASRKLTGVLGIRSDCARILSVLTVHVEAERGFGNRVLPVFIRSLNY